MKTEKIGNVRFYPSTYAAEIGEADVEFTNCCNTNQLQLLINLGTEDGALAIERGRRIVQLWQLAEAFQAGEDIERPFWKFLRNFFVGRRRGPDPDLQPGRVSRDPTQSDKQGKCQE